jgi:5-formyltetrahydrofolate cyclo-ligase
VRERLKTLTAAQRNAASAQAVELLRSQALWQTARSVLFYAPIAGEVDVWPLLATALAEGKTAALPRFDAAANCYVACRIQNATTDVHSGQFGIREPAAHCAQDLLNRLDLILVPGLAFDLHGRRLGRGKGFYDQLLAVVRGVTCGVAFEQQLVSEIPVEPHDVRLEFLLTPLRWVEV